MRPTDLLPRDFRDLLCALHRRDPDWVTWAWGSGADEYAVHPKSWVPDALRQCADSGQDWCGFKALGRWIADGPKTFHPTTDQCQALEQIDVNIAPTDYEQPYPAMMVQLPKGMYGTFTAVLCCVDDTGGPARMITCCLYSENHVDDIVTTVGLCNAAVEHAIQLFDSECGDIHDLAHRVLRVALNSCLALCNFGYTARWAYPKDRDRDERLAREGTERGARARERLATSESVVSFSQEIKLHATCSAPHDCDGDTTGREVKTHWRRGCWAMHAVGEGRKDRRRTFRKPTLVRADRFAGDLSDTSATYNG